MIMHASTNKSLSAVINYSNYSSKIVISKSAYYVIDILIDEFSCDVSTKIKLLFFLFI